MTASVSILIRSRFALSITFLVFSLAEFMLGLTQQSAPTSKTLGAVKEPGPVEAHFDAAQTYQLTGDFERATTEYHQAISAGLQRLGNLKVATGDNAAGIEMLEDAVVADAKNLEARIDLAIAYFRTGQYDKAKERATEVLKTDGANFRARSLLGKVHFMQGNFQAAADDFQAALAINPDFDIAYSLALADLQLKKLPQVTVLFDEMRQSLGNTPELHVLLGQAYRQTGFFDLAAAEFKSAVALDGHYPHAHGYLGMTYLALGGDQNYDLAREQFRLELASAPHDYSSHYFLGLIELERHNAAAAEASLQEAHHARQDDPAPLLLLGRLYNEQKRWPDAIASLREAVGLASSQATPESQITLAHEELSKALVGAGRSAEGAQELAAAQHSRTANPDGSSYAAPETSTAGAAAENDAQTDLRGMLLKTERKPAAPSSDESRYIAAVSKLLGNAYHNVGVIDARGGGYVAAAEEFKQAARWDSSIAQLDQNWGIAAFRAQAYSDAIVPLERLLRRSPNDPNLRQMLGVCYYMTNNFAASAATFRPIVNRLPDNPGLLLAAGIAFARTGDASAGEQLFSRMFAIGATTPEVHLMLGQAYAEQSQGPQALKEFNRALELNAKLPEAHYFSGMVLLKRGDMDDAARQFQSELGLNPSYAPAMYQLAYIRLQQHQAPEATRLLAEVIKQQPTYSDAHYQLGKALLEQGDVNAATRELETSVQLRPTDYAYFQLSRAYSRAGRSNDATEAERNFERLKPKPVVPAASNK